MCSAPCTVISPPCWRREFPWNCRIPRACPGAPSSVLLSTHVAHTLSGLRSFLHRKGKSCLNMETLVWRQYASTSASPRRYLPTQDLQLTPVCLSNEVL